MGIYNLVIYGSFKVGRLMNYFNFSQGWDSLYINIIGLVEFELGDVFYVNYLKIDGRMVVFSFIIMVAFVLDKGLEMYIGGIVVFDVLVLYFLGFWSG